MWEYWCEIERVIDGDTVVVMVDHGMNIHSRQHIRLIGYNAPERGRPHAGEATAALQEYIDRFDRFVLHSVKDKRSFNRYLGTLTPWTGDDIEHVSLNDHMVNLNLPHLVVLRALTPPS